MTPLCMACVLHLHGMQGRYWRGLTEKRRSSSLPPPPLLSSPRRLDLRVEGVMSHCDDRSYLIFPTLALDEQFLNLNFKGAFSLHFLTERIPPVGDGVRLFDLGC